VQLLVVSFWFLVKEQRIATVACFECETAAFFETLVEECRLGAVQAPVQKLTGEPVRPAGVLLCEFDRIRSIGLREVGERQEKLLPQNGNTL